MSVPPSALSHFKSLNLTELRQRLFFLLGALVIYRLGTYIPVPGVDTDALALMFRQQSGSIFNMFNMFSGGALARFSIFALGIMPYISASIIIQLLTFVIPELKELQKEGETGRRKISQYTRYGTVLLSAFQAIGVSLALQNQTAGGLPIVLNPGWHFVLITTITLVTGTIFLMWLGEQITERGLGNGISMIIFAGIVAGLPSALGSTLELVRTGEMSPLTVILLTILAVVVIGFVVYMERAQRRIPVHYAKRQVGRQLFGGHRSFLPLKINMAGVIPPIFASSLILFPGTVASWFGHRPGMEWLQELALWLAPGQPLYVIIYSLAIVFFCFFYTAIVFDSKEIAENLKKAGAFIPGIRPGQQTAQYLDRVMSRLTFFGALYITAVCLLPNVLIMYWNVPFYFGGTSLLIVVVVVMDLMAQIQTYLMSQQYEALMRQAHLKGFAVRGTSK